MWDLILICIALAVMIGGMASLIFSALWPKDQPEGPE